MENKMRTVEKIREILKEAAPLKSQERRFPQIILVLQPASEVKEILRTLLDILS